MSFETNTPFLIAPDGTETEVMPTNKRDFTGQELYDMLDCEVVQLLATRPGWQLWCDQLGKMREKHFNMKATLAATNLFADDYVVGTALLCPAKYVK